MGVGDLLNGLGYCLRVWSPSCEAGACEEGRVSVPALLAVSFSLQLISSSELSASGFKFD